MNKCILMGRVARDPDVRATQSGKRVARLTLAVDRRKGKDNQQPADFINLIVWDKLAEFVDSFIKKGIKLLIEGRLQTRTYEDQAGEKKYITEVVVNDIEFAESKKKENAEPEELPFS